MRRPTFTEGLASGLLLLILVLCWLVYWPGLQGAFLADDVKTLAALNLRGGVTSWPAFQTFVFGSDAGALGRSISMLSFLLNDQYFPGDVASYRFTNLMIHSLCGLGVFVFVRKLLVEAGKADENALFVALFVMAVWLLAPLNVSTVLYVVQRMAQLSMLFILLGLTIYLSWRKEAIQGRWQGWLMVMVGAYGMGLFALLSKENGALIFVYILTIEVFLCCQGKMKASPQLLAVSVVPLVVVVLYFITQWKIFGPAYQFRDFTLGERLLTESRILWNYVLSAWFPSAQLGLIHDDYLISKHLFSPFSTFIALLAHIAVGVGAWTLRRKVPLAMFCALWYYGGHSLESSFIPLELYFEHRNYLPMLGVFILVAVFMWELPWQRAFSWGIAAILVVLSATLCWQQTDLWGKPRYQTARWALEHPDSKRAQAEFALMLYREGQVERANRHLLMMNKKWPNSFHVQMMMLNYRCTGEFSSDITIESILSSGPLEMTRGMVGIQVERSEFLYEKRVCPNLIDTGLIDILNMVVAAEDVFPTTKGTMNFKKAKIYASVGDLNGAITSLNEALSYELNSIYFYKKAEYFASAGLLDLAKKQIDHAILVESSKSFHKQLDMALYQHFRKKLLRGYAQSENDN